MSKNTDYRIISRSASPVYFGETLKEFVETINRYTSSGWEVLGGANIFFANNVYHFHQTLIKEI